MHCFPYSPWFVFVWGSVALAVPGAIGLCAWLAVLARPHEHDHAAEISALAVAVGALVAWTALMRRHAPRVLVRSGAFPAWCRGDRYPRNGVELATAASELLERTGRAPAIVGGGWGYFLKRTGPPAPRVFTHRLIGPRADDPDRWYAGTTIATVVKHYERQGKTLPAHPTMDYVSVGSWVSHANHGNNGDANVPPHGGAFKQITVLNMTANAVMRLDYPAARRLFDGPGGAAFCVVDVSFVVVANDELQKRGILVSSPETAAEWLAPGAALRMMFLGAARPYAIGLRWEKPYEATTHRDPHCCTRFGGFLQVDVLSMFGGWHEPMSRFRGLVSRANANRWVPSIQPFMTVSVVLSGVLNFEIFFKLPEALDGARLDRLVRLLIAMHQKHGGRSEIRYGALSPDSVVHLDLSMNRRFEAPFELLYYELGVRRVALHPGKFDDLSASPCSRVSVSQLLENYAGV